MYELHKYGGYPYSVVLGTYTYTVVYLEGVTVWSTGISHRVYYALKIILYRISDEGEAMAAARGDSYSDG
jgi:hypothetical protein